MIEDATNLTNTTILVGTMEVMKNLASAHWEAITAIIIAAATSGGLVWMIVSTRTQRKHEKAMQQAQHKHEREMEKLRQDYDEKIRQQPKLVAKNQLKSCLEEFASFGDGEQIILLRDQKREELQKKVSELGNEFEIVIKSIEKQLLLPQDIFNEAKNMAKGIKNLSPKIFYRVMLDEEVMKQRDREVVDEWNELMKKAKKFIEELQQEVGEEER